MNRDMHEGTKLATLTLDNYSYSSESLKIICDIVYVRHIAMKYLHMQD